MNEADFCVAELVLTLLNFVQTIFQHFLYHLNMQHKIINTTMQKALYEKIYVFLQNEDPR